MIASYLPDDCIHDILKYLQTFRSTLFNCLLVNRFWCKTTVPLLYADPFSSDLNFVSKNYSSIISTLISCFSKEEILQFKNQLRLNDINIDIDINDENSPLFEYPKYLENFDYVKINSTIFHWFSSPYDPSDAKYKIVSENLIPIFHQSILRQCNNVKQLSISLYLLDNEIYKNCNIQTFTSSLTKLNTLLLAHNHVTNNEVVQEFLSNIANTCLNLKKLEISSYKDNKNLVIKENFRSIIQKQNDLRVIKLSSYYSNFLNYILLSLEVQKYSLVFIEFSNVIFTDDISFKSFINLCNLKYLRFEMCKGTISLDQCEDLKFATFKLEGLYSTHNIWDDDNFIISSMIEYFGASLKELVLIEMLHVPIIEDISIYCPNLYILEIEINPDIDEFSYLKKLKIRTLKIFIDGDWGSSLNEVIICLANNLPSNVKEVSFRSRNLTNSRKLSYIGDFFENCSDCLEIINFENQPIELDLFKIILNYIERSNNSLKFLGMMIKSEWEFEELELFNQIKSEGVKIGDFYYNYKCDYI